MSRDLDDRWLIDQAKNGSAQKVKEILEKRQAAVKDHLFYTGDEIFTLHMGEYLLSMRECSAPASIEVYHEIFRENNHFLHPDFVSPAARCIMDIGANEGFYTLRAASLNPGARIISVEPNPDAFEILTMNIKNNRVENVVPINAAASCDGRDLELDFVRQIHSIGGVGLREVERPWLPEGLIEKRTVKSVSIPALMMQCSFPAIDLLKIDVEGMEDEIIESIRPISKLVRRINVERHNESLRHKVVNTLAGLGFELVYEEDPGFSQYYGDLYFINAAGGR